METESIIAVVLAVVMVGLMRQIIAWYRSDMTYLINTVVEFNKQAAVMRIHLDEIEEEIKAVHRHVEPESQFSPLVNLRNVLAALYPDPESIERIAEDSGISRLRIDLDSSPVNNWHSVLSEAKRINALAALLGRVAIEYGDNPEFKSAAYMIK